MNFSENQLLRMWCLKKVLEQPFCMAETLKAAEEFYEFIVGTESASKEVDAPRNFNIHIDLS